ncbi:TPA: LOW QUALITY PROTEIN: hypothetical protein N0F65_007092, partial [Lagenidium giganteum]
SNPCDTIGQNYSPLHGHHFHVPHCRRRLSRPKRLAATHRLPASAQGSRHATPPPLQLERRAEDMANLTDAQRQCILHFLLEATSEGKLRHGSIANASMQFRTTRWTVKRLWDGYNASNDDDEIPGDVRSRIKGNSGCKPYDTADLVERIRKVPQRKGRKMRQLASAVRVSVSVLRRLMQQGQLRRHANQIKPSLSGMNTTEHILFLF